MNFIRMLPMTGRKLVKSSSKVMASWKATGKMKRRQIEQSLTDGYTPATWGPLMNADESMLSIVKKISSLVAGGIFLRLRWKVSSMADRLFKKFPMSPTHTEKRGERHTRPLVSPKGRRGTRHRRLS